LLVRVASFSLTLADASAIKNQLYLDNMLET